MFGNTYKIFVAKDIVKPFSKDFHNLDKFLGKKIQCQFLITTITAKSIVCNTIWKIIT